MPSGITDRGSSPEDIDPGPGIEPAPDIDPGATSGSAVDPAEPDLHGDALIGATGADDPAPDSLVEGNRVATAEDME